MQSEPLSYVIDYATPPARRHVSRHVRWICFDTVGLAAAFLHALTQKLFRGAIFRDSPDLWVAALIGGASALLLLVVLRGQQRSIGWRGGWHNVGLLAALTRFL